MLHRNNYPAPSLSVPLARPQAPWTIYLRPKSCFLQKNFLVSLEFRSLTFFQWGIKMAKIVATFINLPYGHPEADARMRDIQGALPALPSDSFAYTFGGAEN